MDWYKTNSSRLAIVVHGLEGTASDPCIRSIVALLANARYDSLAMNLRGCSGRPNNLLKSYHSGKSEDLRTVTEHVCNNYDYQDIAIIAYSAGGNIALKYLGEEANKLNPKVKRAATISVPIDLASASDALAKPVCQIYMKFLLDKLHAKIRIKKSLFPGEIDDKDFTDIKTFHQYDRLYTAPLNGFLDERDYWTHASSIPWLTKIAIPTLLVNALDDPFLGPECFPYAEAKLNPNLQLLTPKYGGHLGFFSVPSLLPLRFEFWHEKIILDFLQGKPLTDSEFN